MKFVAIALLSLIRAQNSTDIISNVPVAVDDSEASDLVKIPSDDDLNEAMTTDNLDPDTDFTPTNVAMFSSMTKDEWKMYSIEDQL